MSAVAVVDASNRFIRWTSREEVHRERLWHRSVHVLLFTAAGDWVVQRRHPSKRTWPGAWDVAVAGHVEASDYVAGPDDALDAVYDAVAARELTEELGVSAPLRRVGAFGPQPGVHYEHLRLYVGRSDGPFVPQPEEVSEVRVVSRAELVGLAPKTRALEAWMVWAEEVGCVG